MAVDAEERIAAFLAESLPDVPWELEPLGAGGNNRTYMVRQGADRYVLKEYFRHPGDQRDRAAAEFAFARFAWRHGLRCLPEPLACDLAAGIGLFEYVAGERLAPGSVGSAEVAEALDFVIELNRCRQEPSARELPAGSEACFAIGRHLELIRARLARLEQLEPRGSVEQEAQAFVRDRLKPAFLRLAEDILQQATAAGLTMTAELDPAGRLISPSDFGLHNALRRPDGSLVFLDFEYAGWDDPAKLTGDFFSQVAVPVPLAYREMFCAGIATLLPDPMAVLKRMALLLPLYRIKWCCIVLNQFLPLDAARRKFARQEPEDVKVQQLTKAQALLAALPALID